VMGMSLPAVLHRTHTELEGTTSEIALSRFTSICLLGIYFSYLYFQLVTHTELFEDNEEEDENDDEVRELYDALISLAERTLV
jgi:Ca2+:H+ antiporter